MNRNNVSLKIPESYIVTLSIATLAIILLGVGVYYGKVLGDLNFSHHDEFLTLDRTFSFARHNDYLTVYSENYPNFRKPPLQYWISAVFFELGLDKQIALRLPSLIFGLALILVMSVFAYILYPTNSLVLPFAACLIASQTAFWQLATSALLDIGNVLFSLIAFFGVFMALKRKIWWFVVAFACILGALQKAPIPLVLAICAVMFLRISGAIRSLKILTQQSAFRISLILVFLGVSVWPVIQIVQYGSDALKVSFISELLEKFVPTELAREGLNVRNSFSEIILGKDPVIRILGLLSVFWLSWKSESRAPRALAFIMFMYLLLEAFRPEGVSGRYFIHFVPIIAVALSVSVLSLRIANIWKVGAVVVLVYVSGGIFKDPLDLKLQENIPIDVYIPMLERIARETESDDILVFCHGGLSRDSNITRIRAPAFSHYAANKKTFNKIKPEGLPDFLSRITDNDKSVRGLCALEQMKGVMTKIDNFAIIQTQDDYIYWTITRKVN